MALECIHLLHFFSGIVALSVQLLHCVIVALLSGFVAPKCIIAALLVVLLHQCNLLG